MKKIYSSLDLTKCLKDFQEQVTKLLEISNIAEWNGQTLKAREENIRKAALILAGECISLLLYNLSQSQEVHHQAMNQTQGWWHPTTKKHGYKKRQMLTLGNVEVTLKLPYVVENQKQVDVESDKDKNQNKKPINTGFVPFLKWLGIEEGLTPSVWSNIAQYGAIGGSFEAARKILIDWGIDISLKRIERLTYKFGKIGINLRNEKLTELQFGSLSTKNVLKDQRVVIAVDGGRTRIRIPKKGRPRAKTNRRGFTGEWIEPKLLTIYVVNEQGKKVKTSAIPITNDGTYQGYKGFCKF
ncbi:hypothetical protein SR1949_12000 [Sphaerospermopsis reniformis]|uniref:Uncharacterized protein n=1 Tax=Sphaerospermopsis reniformis TaxID=531300 RepID=A0A479ZTS5_9CYAN|nr:hypothetical protein SR1949_12000 [Sphaerospermopsis reniformis]